MTAHASPAFRFIDLFAGIGGMRLPFDAIGGECVFTSEWDKYCQQTYRRNFTVDQGMSASPWLHTRGGQ